MTRPLEHGWKILRSDRTSIIISHEDRVVLYRLNHRAYPRPRCGPLAVFMDRGYAADFLLVHGFYRRERDSYLLVPCRYEQSPETRMWIDIGTIHYSHALLVEDPRERCSFTLPVGTVLANFVTCLE